MQENIKMEIFEKQDDPVEEKSELMSWSIKKELQELRDITLRHYYSNNPLDSVNNINEIEKRIEELQAQLLDQIKAEGLDCTIPYLELKIAQLS